MSGPVRLCTDSSAQLPPALAAALDVDVVPIGIALDGRLHDETELDADVFYQQLRAGAHVTTSQPSPGRLSAAYAAAAERGAGEVLSIHVAAAVSGTVGAAELAAREAAVPVTVVDSGTVSFGVALCVIAAARILAGGGSGADAVRAIERLAPRLRNAFVAAGAPGGRVPDRPGFPVLSFAGSRAEVVASADSLDDAAPLVAALALAAREPIAVAVGHADRATEPAADRLAELLARAREVVDVMRYRVGPSVGAHTGPLTFGAFWWPAAASS